jgi:hypothetical protein
MFKRPRSSQLPAGQCSRSRTLLALSFALALAGCPEGDEDLPGERGEIGACNFVYRCVNNTDNACAGAQAVLPAAVAVGGRFAMTCTVSSGPLPTVLSPASELVRDDGHAFQALRPGLFPLLAVTGNTEVIDLKHMRASAIAEVRVQPGRDLPVARLSLIRGQMVELTAVPYDAHGAQLGGALTYGWRSADERYLSVETLPQLNTVRVRAVGDGSTSLMVTVAGQSFPVAVTVGDPTFDAGVPLDGAVDATAPHVDAESDALAGDAGVGSDT